MLEKIPELTLNDGLKLPSIGFGTCQLNGSQGAETVRRAVKA